MKTFVTGNLLILSNYSFCNIFFQNKYAAEMHKGKISPDYLFNLFPLTINLHHTILKLSRQLKSLLQMEELLIIINFSFSHNYFKSRLMQTRHKVINVF